VVEQDIVERRKPIPAKPGQPVAQSENFGLAAA
jgi:hypothetical protein